MKNTVSIPENEMVSLAHQFTLSPKEAAKYFRIGENKIRSIIQQDRNAKFVLWNGNRPQIKRQLFEEYLNGAHSL